MSYGYGWCIRFMQSTGRYTQQRSDCNRSGRKYSFHMLSFLLPLSGYSPLSELEVLILCVHSLNWRSTDEFFVFQANIAAWCSGFDLELSLHFQTNPIIIPGSQQRVCVYRVSVHVFFVRSIRQLWRTVFNTMAALLFNWHRDSQNPARPYLFA